MLEKNLLARAQAQGISCIFANAYPSQFIHLAWTKRPAGPPLAAHGAGIFTRDEEDLARGSRRLQRDSEYRLADSSRASPTSRRSAPRKPGETWPGSRKEPT